ncbi:hypothetical protein DMA15_33030 [Streptomyces sp. WAC 01529]|uniref:endonuclease/exonuclease/phosphatase family protein n=1 Tax=Streptomyces sp. WAC 01529 TaxID=2203205 RepID=UPI000F6DFE44|nr:endonuclease/exonuclease/phosphatase family protein [Streptomyces sp. WAC 01529]AZM56812.1 hypothetical protein DMA15_33030 [Streptomyces sp. WAC 01529]
MLTAKRTATATIVSLAVATGFFTASATASTAPSAPAGTDSSKAQALPARITALTWNICGAIKECPEAEATPEKKIDEIMRQVNADRSIGVIMIQEACKSLHSDRLADRLGSDWIVRHRTGKTVGTNNLIECPSSTAVPKTKDAGTAVAVKKIPGTTPMAWDVTFPGTRGLEHVEGKGDKPRTNHTTQGMACAGLRSSNAANRLVACSSHFVHRGVHNQERIRAVSARDMAAWGRLWQRQGFRTVLGGDLNTLPGGGGRLKPLYDMSFEGDWNDECDTTGYPWLTGCSAVAGSKFDYLFFGDRGLRYVGGDVVNGADPVASDAYKSADLSDHWMLKATVRPVPMR